jgi:hypothetical protein
VAIRDAKRDRFGASHRCEILRVEGAAAFRPGANAGRIFVQHHQGAEPVNIPVGVARSVEQEARINADAGMTRAQFNRAGRGADTRDFDSRRIFPYGNQLEIVTDATSAIKLRGVGADNSARSDDPGDCLESQYENPILISHGS